MPPNGTPPHTPDYLSTSPQLACPHTPEDLSTSPPSFARGGMRVGYAGSPSLVTSCDSQRWDVSNSTLSGTARC
jgi:hypothetical protein